MSTIRLRVNKGDAAYLYQLLESYEGLTAYTTLPGAKQDSYRDLELAFPESLNQDLASVLQGIGAEISLSILHPGLEPQLVDGNSELILGVDPA